MAQYGGYTEFDHEPSAVETGQEIQRLLRQLQSGIEAQRQFNSGIEAQSYRIDIYVKPRAPGGHWRPGCANPDAWTVGVKLTSDD